MSEVTRVFVPIDSQEPESLQVALGYAEKIIETVGHVHDAVLLVHTKNQLSSTSLSRFLGASAIKELINKKTLNLPSGTPLRAETMATLRFLSRRSVIIVFYAEDKILEYADGLNNVAGVVAVPDLPQDGQNWVVRWNPIVHGQPRQPPKALISDAVVVQALKTLTTVINRTTGLGHSRDKAMANDILRILRAKGHADPSASIRSWAIQSGWPVHGAAELEVLSKKIWGLKARPSLAAIHDPEGRYARWCACAE